MKRARLLLITVGLLALAFWPSVYSSEVEVDGVRTNFNDEKMGLKTDDDVVQR